MKVEPFDLDKHLSELHSWESIHEAPLSPPAELARIGAVVSDSTGMVAMGFLRLVEGNRAQIDDLITNPDKSPEARDAAINLVGITLLSTAKSLEIKSVLAYSKDDHTVIRSQKLGLTKQPHTLLAVNLKNWSI